MKAFFIVILILGSLNVLAQNDEMPETRNKRESFAKVQQKDIRADLASFTLSGVNESVGKEEFKKISFTSFGSNFMNFSGDDIKASVTTAPFDPSTHKLDYDEKYLVKIDRKTYYGGYPKVPVNYISQVTIIIGNDSVIIPRQAYFDLYNLNLTYTDKSGTARSTNGIYRSKDGHKIYLYLFSKDNSGSYEVTWVIQDKKYLRRVLDYGFM